MSAASGASSLTGLAGASGDATSIAALRSAAARDPKAAIRETAKQFEALFMQQLMKSMREATMSSGMLDNSGTQLGTEMLDTQFANQMTLPDATDGRVTRHLSEICGTERQQPHTRAPARRSSCRFASGMAGADNQDIKHNRPLADRAEPCYSRACSFHVKRHFPKQNRENNASRTSSMPARPVRRSNAIRAARRCSASRTMSATSLAASSSAWASAKWVA